MYTVLSGFVEHCESVEECFAREAMEEVGLELKDITLVGSQPWPIGRAGSCELILACRAVACSEELNVNRDEVEDARFGGHSN
jgi:NAD+ diphosphatase